MHKNNMIINDTLELCKEIGKGSFGEVYSAVDITNGKELACKIEQKRKKTRLKSEFNIYKRFKIKKLLCVPKVYNYYETPKYNIMTMDLLGKSIEEIFNDNNKKFDFGTVIKLGIKITKAIKEIHGSGIIHRDIKPSNFMFDFKNNLYIMDFGLSKKWFHNKKHIEFRTGGSLIGTARYASVNIHLGFEPSRRDDLESIAYMLIYLLKGSLPWQGLKSGNKGQRINRIGEEKLMVDLNKLCHKLPDCFLRYIKYTRNLEFDERPDYDFLIDILEHFAHENSIIIKYFWEN